MRYFAAIWVVMFCFIGSGMSHTQIDCVTCDSIPADSVKRIVVEESKAVIVEALDSLKARFNEVNTKHQILILKTAMLERKMCKPVMGRVDSFRTLTGWWVVKWWYVNGKFVKTTNEKN